MTESHEKRSKSIGQLSEGIKSFKQYYHRFRKWQQAMPQFVNRHQDTTQQCHNCGTEYGGNFCPICGQRAGIGRVGWKSIEENVSLLWGLDSRSLPYTLLQLLLRPGYLVRDYISGHRQVSYPPVKMLVILSLFAVIIESVFHVKNEIISLHFNIPEIDEVVQWFNTNKSWATLFTQIFFILPTWAIFRFAPRYPRHSLPEGFFLQVFVSVQSLLLGLLNYLFGNGGGTLGAIFTFITYWQLFGYGWWSTLWRFIVTVITSLILMLPMIMIGFLYGQDDTTSDKIAVGLILCVIIAFLIAAILYVSYLIGKRTYRKSLTKSRKYLERGGFKVFTETDENEDTRLLYFDLKPFKDAQNS